MKKTVKNIFRKFGIDVRSVASVPKIEADTAKYVKFADVGTIVDIGAARGEFGMFLREAGYAGRIISFEPLSQHYTQLTSAARSDAAWEIAERCAIGNHDGEIAINISENSFFSSALAVTADTVDLVSAARSVKSQTVPLRRLDTVLPAYNVSGAFLLKIDTQGFEWNVMDGAPETLSRATGVLCEMSLVEVYEGQRLWTDILARMSSLGFSLWHIKSAFDDPALFTGGAYVAPSGA